MTRSRFRSAAGLLLVVGLVVAAAACSSSNSNGHKASAGAGKVTITVNALPAATDKADRQKFLDDVALFERQNPNIKVVPHEGKMDPQTFSPPSSPVGSWRTSSTSTSPTRRA